MPAKKDSAPAVLPPAVLESTDQAVSTVRALADIPEEDIWLAKQKSKRTRRAYKQDVWHFMRTLTIRSYEELRKVDHRAVIAWERTVREIEAFFAATKADLRYPGDRGFYSLDGDYIQIPVI
jgi:hypothetical protein